MADIFGRVQSRIEAARAAAAAGTTRLVTVGGTQKEVRYPFPSPTDWRDCWIYFMLLDRFNNPGNPARSTSATPPIPWDHKYDFRQGGTFNGVRSQLGYISQLGAGAIWLSPVLKNSRPDSWEYNYHGYGAQDFLNVDERFASDGTRATAEKELAALVDEAHARGLYVIIDVVINHAARVFDYLYGRSVTDKFSDPTIMQGPPGSEPTIEWLNGYGLPRSDWLNTLPPPASLSPDDAVWPSDLQRPDFFRRRGTTLSQTPPPDGPIPGDFEVMRQLVVEYDAAPDNLAQLRDLYGRWPVHQILTEAYAYLIAKYDVDGFRIDTVKFVAPDMVRRFGNAIREFALSMGKQNFFTFGEIWGSEGTISRFVGRNSTQSDGFGIDAALDYPLFYALPGTAKGLNGVESVRDVLDSRKRAEEGQISSHGEAGRYFVTFLDNHDQNERFHHPATPDAQVWLGLAALFTMQGIPCVYYGTEQGLTGTKDADGKPVLDSLESVREALWGKPGGGFDPNHPIYQFIQALARLRIKEAALRYGRIYFREVSGNGQDFGLSVGRGGVLAYSRIVADREVVVVANTNTQQPFTGRVIVDLDLGRRLGSMTTVLSNLQSSGGTAQIEIVEGARFFYSTGAVTIAGRTAAISVSLGPSEIQVLAAE
jgi:glycosidase